MWNNRILTELGKEFNCGASVGAKRCQQSMGQAAVAASERHPIYSGQRACRSLGRMDFTSSISPSVIRLARILNKTRTTR
jgi:hypothetical protein